MIHRSYESEPRYDVTQVQVNISLVHNSAMNKQQSITIKLKTRDFVYWIFDKIFWHKVHWRTSMESWELIQICGLGLANPWKSQWDSEWNLCGRVTYIYMRHLTGPSLVHVMDCRLFCTKPLSKPMMTYCQFGAKEQSPLNSFYWN